MSFSSCNAVSLIYDTRNEHTLTWVQTVGEMSTLFPIPGAFIELAGRFVDPALAFSVGYNYWYLWVTNIAGVFFFFNFILFLIDMLSIANSSIGDFNASSVCSFKEVYILVPANLVERLSWVIGPQQYLHMDGF